MLGLGTLTTVTPSRPLGALQLGDRQRHHVELAGLELGEPDLRRQDRQEDAIEPDLAGIGLVALHFQELVGLVLDEREGARRHGRLERERILLELVRRDLPRMCCGRMPRPEKLHRLTRKAPSGAASVIWTVRSSTRHQSLDRRPTPS